MQSDDVCMLEILELNSLTLIFEFVERDLKQYMDACNGMMHMNNVKVY